MTRKSKSVDKNNVFDARSLQSIENIKMFAGYEWLYNCVIVLVYVKFFFCKLTVWNLKAIKGRTKSNHAVIFLPNNSGNMTIKEFPMLRTTISALAT